MIKEIVTLWERNKSLLEKELRQRIRMSNCQLSKTCSVVMGKAAEFSAAGTEELSYDELIKFVIRDILNSGESYADCDYGSSFSLWRDTAIHRIDDGEYSGTLIYIIPYGDISPEPNEYLVTVCEYGSCELCDALEGIIWMLSRSEREKGEEWDDSHELRKWYYQQEDLQVRDLMSLCLNMIQRIRFLFPPENNEFGGRALFRTGEEKNRENHNIG